MVSYSSLWKQKGLQLCWITELWKRYDCTTLELFNVQLLGREGKSHMQVFYIYYIPNQMFHCGHSYVFGTIVTHCTKTGDIT